MLKIEKIELNDIDGICELADIIFSEHMSGNKEYVNYSTNWDISVKLTLDGNIIGFYLFNDSNLSQDIFNDKRGVQGVALGVNSEYRDLGYGKMLIEESYKLFSTYDYIWGMHLSSLGNLEDWKKRRTILNEGSNLFLSYKFIKDD